MRQLIGLNEEIKARRQGGHKKIVNRGKLKKSYQPEKVIQTTIKHVAGGRISRRILKETEVIDHWTINRFDHKYTKQTNGRQWAEWTDLRMGPKWDKQTEPKRR